MPSLRSKFCRFLVRNMVGSKYKKGASIVQIRKGLEDATRLAFLPANTSVEEISFSGIPAEWVYSKKADEENVVLYLHGGGYNSGSPSTHRELAAHISKDSKAKVLLTDYRLAPEYPFPAALEDSIQSYRWLIEAGYSSDKIAIAGDSAGGGLTLATCVSLKDSNDPMPSSLVCISPWTDLEITGESVEALENIDPMVNLASMQLMASNYIATNDPRSPLISPLHADFSKFPPILIHVGSNEMLLDDSKRVAEKAKQAGVDVTLNIYQEMWHVFHVFYRLMPEAKKAVRAIGSFIEKNFRR